MGRYLGPSCKLCRREGVKLMIKGTRCISEKCALNKKKAPPGKVSFKRRAKISEYGIQLREKQKVKRMYCLLERQFYNYFEKASRIKGKTGEILLNLLERRLDNVVYRMCLGSSRNQSRQLVSHGHILVNGKCVDIPSYSVKPNDEIAVKESSKNITIIRESLKNLTKAPAPAWLEIDENNLKGKVLALPERHEIDVPADENLIVELYSK